VGIAALGITTMGVVPSYAACLLLVTVGSLGIAAFHPQAYKSTHLVSGDRPATGMAIFAVGGNIGHAVGPIFITSIILAFGLRGAYLGMLPGLLVAAALLWVIPANRHRLIRRRGAPAGTPSAEAADGPVGAAAHPPIPWGPLTLLMTVVIVRSWGQVALTSYIPLFSRDYLGEPPIVGSTVLLVYLGAGAAGTLVGGPVADRYGARMTLAVTMLLSTPLMFAFPHLRGLLAMVVIGLTGFLIISTFALTIVIAQALLPTRGGVAAGLVFGFAVGSGGIGVTMLGAVADAWGLFVAMHVLAAVPVLAVPFVWALPADVRGARKPR
jgi:FSR family fosmidomycin resistance protein-like MFS transporter